MSDRTGPDAVRAFTRIREGLPQSAPKLIDTDKDTCFTSAQFQDYLKDNDIGHQTQDTGQHWA